MDGLYSLRVVAKRALRLAPYPWRKQVRTIYRTIRQANDVVSRAESIPDLSAWYDTVANLSELHTTQKKSEIISLLSIVQEMEARYVCEIGTSTGGTFLLLMRTVSPASTLVSVDIYMPWFRRFALHRTKRKEQRLIFIEGDSTSAESLARVQNGLKGAKLDFLLIDGDHSYEGVKSDFDKYSPLVRQGGLIAFHDIVPDAATRYGTLTGSRTGEVPRFWQEVRQLYNASELIENVDQDGYGLGLIRWEGTR